MLDAGVESAGALRCFTVSRVLRLSTRAQKRRWIFSQRRHAVCADY
jgi:hypothetical protein